MTSATDKDLLQALREAATDVGMSATALIQLGRATAEWQRYAFVWPDGPFPRVIDEVDLTEGTRDMWPEWVRGLVSEGSKCERLHWPDGSFTIRLVTARAQVLAAKHYSTEEAGKTWQD